jgi:Serine dehydrogenase proteinase
MSTSYEGLFPRGKALPSQSPLFWVSQKDRYLRQLLIRDIEETTSRCLLVYFTDCTSNAQIDTSDEKYLSELLGSSDKQEVDLLLETNGGYTDATEKVVSLLRHWVGDLRVIVPSRAKSNGTVIALASNSIVMGANSELGPIDPNIAIQPGQFVPAHFIVNLTPVDPLIYQIADQAIKQTQKLAKTVLKERMLSEADETVLESIVGQISTRNVYYSHGSVIDYREAISLGLKVSFLEPQNELWQRLWLLRSMYEYDCRQNQLSKIFESNRISSGIALS